MAISFIEAMFGETECSHEAIEVEELQGIDIRLTIYSFSSRSLVDAVYALKDEVHELKKVQFLVLLVLLCLLSPNVACLRSDET